jgi:uncharacterized protein YceH (UPF0502 family)
VSYGEDVVTSALTSLRERQLIRIVYPAHARVTKYRHVLGEVWALTPQELAVVAVLLLRGPQTVNEMKSRTERYASLGDLGGVEGVLDRLAGRPEPLVVHLGRGAGQRDDRYGHLLGPMPSPSVVTPDSQSSETTLTTASTRPTRLDTLEEEIRVLRVEINALRERVDRLSERG